LHCCHRAPSRRAFDAPRLQRNFAAPISSASFNKTRFPPASAHRQRTKSFGLPKQAQLFCVGIQAQYRLSFAFGRSSAALLAIALN
jgi:hypothetical protein